MAKWCTLAKMSDASNADFLKDFGKPLDYCWVCQQLLSDRGGLPHFVRNSHHIIPQAFGGKNGPTVTLDSSHHDLLHAVALRLTSNKSYDDLIARLTPSELQRIMYLATRIKIAFDFSNGDPNKQFKVTFQIGAKTNQQLKDIAKFKSKSKEDIFILLVEEAHRRLFPSKR